MNVRVVVPRRADHGHRDRLWAHCRAVWVKSAPSWSVVEGHHLDGPFNRAAAVNRAAAGDWDVAVITDADVVLDLGSVKQAVERAHLSGRMVLPFTRRVSVSEAGTMSILEGYRGSWRRWITERQQYNVSTCVVVPRRLWDEIGGFDERFETWGGEDDAFWAACAILAGVDRLPGDAWHLWHEPSPERDHRSSDYRLVKALATRYRSIPGDAAMRQPAVGPGDDRSVAEMRRLLTESRAPDQIVLCCLSNGLRDTLDKTLHSADEMLSGPIGRRVVALDSRDDSIEGRLRLEHPRWDVVRVSGGSYSRAVAAGVDVAIGSGQPWVFWLEDDFTFPQPVDLPAMQNILTDNPDLAQLALLRQPWYPAEVAAGGVMATHPEAYEQRDGWVGHREFWTMNPHLIHRSSLAAHSWPLKPDSEARFGALMLANPATVFGYLGDLDDPPRCTHIGEKRAGRGY